MANEKSLPEEIEALFHAKQKRRKELAKLTFEEKIKILIELQKMSLDFKDPKNRDKYRAWDISL